jgi:ketosteroid isomerase-like protein
MDRSELELVRDLFDRFGGGGLESALELVADDFVAVVPPSMSAEPDVYEGHEGARRYFAAFEGSMDHLRYELLELLDEGEVLIARIRVVGRGAVSGIEVQQHAAVILRVAEGKVTYMEPHRDLDAAREALPG